MLSAGSHPVAPHVAGTVAALLCTNGPPLITWLLYLSNDLGFQELRDGRESQLLPPRCQKGFGGVGDQNQRDGSFPTKYFTQGEV